MFAFRHSRPCHAVPCPHRAHAWAPGEPGRRPGWQPGTSSLCAWCPVGRSAGGCSRVGRPKATELGPSPAPASMVNPPGTINPLAWLIPCALALLAELGGLGVPGGPHSHHPCPGLHPAGTYRLLGAVAARLPRVCVIADLDFVGRHPVVPAWGRGSVGSRTCPPQAPQGWPCLAPYVQMELSPCVMTPVKLVSRRASTSSHCSVSSCPAHQPPS